MQRILLSMRDIRATGNPAMVNAPASQLEAVGLEMMATLHLICGMAGAGKTTLARQLQADTGALRLRPDEWIEALVTSKVLLHFLDIPKEELWRRIQKRDAERPEGGFRISKADLEEWCSWFTPPDEAELSLYDSFQAYAKAGG
jgi:predicted kinase